MHRGRSYLTAARRAAPHPGRNKMAKASMILALACMVVMLPASMGALMAIEFGSEFIKVSLVEL